MSSIHLRIRSGRSEIARLVIIDIFTIVMKEEYDVIIVGGGPAGLSAALILARCLRRIVLFDHGQPRNWKSDEIHGFLSRDCCEPKELLRISKEQLLRYDVEIKNVEIVEAKVNGLFEVTDSNGVMYKAKKLLIATGLVDCVPQIDDVEIKNVEIVEAKVNGLFEVTDSNGVMYKAKKLLIATGLVDCVPQIDGIEEFYGKSVHHCPYCDGYEVRLKSLAVVGNGKSGVGMAVSLTTWSHDVTLFTNGIPLTEEEKEKIAIKKIHVRHEKILRLEGKDGELETIVLENGDRVARKALFFTSDKYQHSHIAEQIGCEFTKKGVVKTNKFQQTNVPEVYVAGDAARDVQLWAIAVAEGAKAAVIINQSFQKENMPVQV